MWGVWEPGRQILGSSSTLRVIGDHPWVRTGVRQRSLWGTAPYGEAIVDPGHKVQIVGVRCSHDRVVDRSDYQSDVGQRLGDLDTGRVRDVKHVLVPHLELGGEYEAVGIAQVQVIDHGNDRSREARAVDAQSFGHLPNLSTIEEDRGRLGQSVGQATGFSERLCEGNPPLAEIDHALYPSRNRVGRHGAEGGEGLRFAVEIDGIAWMRPDIVGGLIDQRAERGCGAAPLTLEHHPGLVSWPLRSARARDRIEDVLTRVIRREPIGSVHFAKHTNERGPLLNQRHDSLRVDRAVLDGIYNFLLNLRRGSAQCPDCAGVGHGYVPAGVDILVGQRDEIAGPDTGFDRNIYAARGGLKDRDADAVANAERDLSRGTPIGEYRADPGRVACEGINDLRRDLDQGIRQACRVIGIPAAVNFTNLRPRGRHDGTGAAREGEKAQNGYACKMPRPTHNATPRRYVRTPPTS